MRAMPRPKRAPEGTTSTRDRVLAVAIGLMQERGYNGFSFQDVAKQVGISHVAVHHHFASKSALAVAAMSAYTVNFRALLDEIDAREPTPAQALHAYVELFAATLHHDQRICLCGMLTAEYATLPAEVQPEVRSFYDVNEQWLAGYIRIARRGVRSPSPLALARAFLASLEGAMMSARAFGDAGRLREAGAWLTGSIAGK